MADIAISAEAAGQAAKSSAPKRNYASRLFGYDVFISFALGETDKSTQQIEIGKPPRSTRSYASDLARRLRERDITVFFSETEAAPGEQLDSALEKALYKSHILVVVANRGTLEEPNWVRTEVEKFRKRRPDRPIIPISVDHALQDAIPAESTHWLECRDKIWLDESQDAAATGIASDEVVERLALAPAGRRSNVKWRWVVRAVIAGLLVLAVAATGFGIYAQRKAKEARDSLKEANRQQAEAVKSAAEAKRQQGLAVESAAEANRQEAAALASAAEAKRQQGFAEKQTAAAEQNARESKARELAASARESLNEDPETSILLAMQAVNATVRFGEPSVAAAEGILHEAILFSRIRCARPFNYGPNSGPVMSVAWSPDGKSLALAVDSDTVIWDTTTGKEKATLTGHYHFVYSVAWSPDGKRLATGGHDTTARVWDAATGQETLTLRGHTDRVKSVAWSQDGTRVATASADGTARVWDTSTGKELSTLRGHKSSVNSVAWSPDGTRLVTAGDDRTAKIWNATGEQLQTLSGPKAAAWSPDGMRLATANEDGTVRLWAASSGTELLTLHGKGWIDDVAWSRDGERLVSWGEMHAELWDAGTGKETLSLPFPRSYITLHSVGLSPDGQWLATGSEDKTLRLWTTAKGRELLTLGGEGNVMSVAWSPDGRRLATGSVNNTASVWDAETGKELQTLSGHRQFVKSVAWSPDGQRLLTTSADQTARVWDAATSQELLRLRGPKAAAWSPDGKRVATTNGDGTATVWDATSPHELLSLGGNGDSLFGVAWSPDGKRLATPSSDKTAKVWDAASGQELLTLLGQNIVVTSVAWSPDGKRLAAASDVFFGSTGEANVAKVWEAVHGRELLTLRGHADWVRSVAWSPNGKRLATASGDQTAKVWDSANGQELLTLRAHNGIVRGVAWSPDGKRLASGGDDGIVQVYAMDIHDLLKLARSRVTRDLTPDECLRYFQNKTCPPLP